MKKKPHSTKKLWIAILSTMLLLFFVFYILPGILYLNLKTEEHIVDEGGTIEYEKIEVQENE